MSQLTSLDQPYKDFIQKFSDKLRSNPGNTDFSALQAETYAELRPDEQFDPTNRRPVQWADVKPGDIMHVDGNEFPIIANPDGSASLNMNGELKPLHMTQYDMLKERKEITFSRPTQLDSLSSWATTPDVDMAAFFKQQQPQTSYMKDFLASDSNDYAQFLRNQGIDIPDIKTQQQIVEEGVDWAVNVDWVKDDLFHLGGGATEKILNSMVKGATKAADFLGNVGASVLPWTDENIYSEFGRRSANKAAKEGYSEKEIDDIQFFLEGRTDEKSYGFEDGSVAQSILVGFGEGLGAPSMAEGTRAPLTPATFIGFMGGQALSWIGLAKATKGMSHLFKGSKWWNKLIDSKILGKPLSKLAKAKEKKLLKYMNNADDKVKALLSSETPLVPTLVDEKLVWAPLQKAHKAGAVTDKIADMALKESRDWITYATTGVVLENMIGGSRYFWDNENYDALTGHVLPTLMGFTYVFEAASQARKTMTGEVKKNLPRKAFNEWLDEAHKYNMISADGVESLKGLKNEEFYTQMDFIGNKLQSHMKNVITRESLMERLARSSSKNAELNARMKQGASVQDLVNEKFDFSGAIPQRYLSWLNDTVVSRPQKIDLDNAIDAFEAQSRKVASANENLKAFDEAITKTPDNLVQGNDFFVKLADLEKKGKLPDSEQMNEMVKNVRGALGLDPYINPKRHHDGLDRAVQHADEANKSKVTATTSNVKKSRGDGVLQLDDLINGTSDDVDNATTIVKNTLSDDEIAQIDVAVSEVLDTEVKLTELLQDPDLPQEAATRIEKFLEEVQAYTANFKTKATKQKYLESLDEDPIARLKKFKEEANAMQDRAIVTKVRSGKYGVLDSYIKDIDDDKLLELYHSDDLSKMMKSSEIGFYLKQYFDPLALDAILDGYSAETRNIFKGIVKNITDDPETGFKEIFNRFIAGESDASRRIVQRINNIKKAHEGVSRIVPDVSGVNVATQTDEGVKVTIEKNLREMSIPDAIRYIRAQSESPEAFRANLKQSIEEGMFGFVKEDIGSDEAFESFLDHTAGNYMNDVGGIPARDVNFNPNAAITDADGNVISDVMVIKQGDGLETVVRIPYVTQADMSVAPDYGQVSVMRDVDPAALEADPLFHRNMAKQSQIDTSNKTRRSEMEDEVYEGALKEQDPPDPVNDPDPDSQIDDVPADNTLQGKVGKKKKAKQQTKTKLTDEEILAMAEEDPELVPFRDTKTTKGEKPSFAHMHVRTHNLTLQALRDKNPNTELLISDDNLDAAINMASEAITDLNNKIGGLNPDADNLRSDIFEVFARLKLFLHKTSDEYGTVVSQAKGAKLGKDYSQTKFLNKKLDEVRKVKEAFPYMTLKDLDNFHTSLIDDGITIFPTADDLFDTLKNLATKPKANHQGYVLRAARYNKTGKNGKIIYRQSFVSHDEALSGQGKGFAKDVEFKNVIPNRKSKQDAPFFSKMYGSAKGEKGGVFPARDPAVDENVLKTMDKVNASMYGRGKMPTPSKINNYFKMRNPDFGVADKDLAILYNPDMAEDASINVSEKFIAFLQEESKDFSGGFFDLDDAQLERAIKNEATLLSSGLHKQQYGGKLPGGEVTIMRKLSMVPYIRAMQKGKLVVNGVPAQKHWRTALGIQALPAGIGLGMVEEGEDGEYYLDFDIDTGDMERMALASALVIGGVAMGNRKGVKAGLRSGKNALANYWKKMAAAAKTARSAKKQYVSVDELKNEMRKEIQELDGSVAQANEWIALSNRINVDDAEYMKEMKRLYFNTTGYSGDIQSMDEFFETIDNMNAAFRTITGKELRFDAKEMNAITKYMVMPIHVAQVHPEVWGYVSTSMARAQQESKMMNEFADRMPRFFEGVSKFNKVDMKVMDDFYRMNMDSDWTALKGSTAERNLRTMLETNGRDPANASIMIDVIEEMATMQRELQEMVASRLPVDKRKAYLASIAKQGNSLSLPKNRGSGDYIMYYYLDPKIASDVKQSGIVETDGLLYWRRFKSEKDARASMSAAGSGDLNALRSVISDLRRKGQDDLVEQVERAGTAGFHVVKATKARDLLDTDPEAVIDGLINIAKTKKRMAMAGNNMTTADMADSAMGDLLSFKKNELSKDMIDIASRGKLKPTWESIQNVPGADNSDVMASFSKYMRGVIASTLRKGQQAKFSELDSALNMSNLPDSVRQYIQDYKKFVLYGPEHHSFTKVIGITKLMMYIDQLSWNLSSPLINTTGLITIVPQEMERVASTLGLRGFNAAMEINKTLVDLVKDRKYLAAINRSPTARAGREIPNSVLDKDEAEFLLDMSRRGLLGQTPATDFMPELSDVMLGGGTWTKGRLTGAASKVASAGVWIFSKTEEAVRMASVLSYYRMLKKANPNYSQGKLFLEAKNLAAGFNARVNVDYNPWNRPGINRVFSGALSPMMTFRSFMMNYMNLAGLYAHESLSHLSGSPGDRLMRTDISMDALKYNINQAPKLMGGLMNPANMKKAVADFKTPVKMMLGLGLVGGYKAMPMVGTLDELRARSEGGFLPGGGGFTMGEGIKMKAKNVADSMTEDDSAMEDIMNGLVDGFAGLFGEGVPGVIQKSGLPGAEYFPSLTGALRIDTPVSLNEALGMVHSGGDQLLEAGKFWGRGGPVGTGDKGMHALNQIVQHLPVIAPRGVRRLMEATTNQITGDPLVTKGGSLELGPDGRPIIPSLAENFASALGFNPGPRAARISDKNLRYRIGKFKESKRQPLIDKFQTALARRDFEQIRKVVVNDIGDYNSAIEDLAVSHKRPEIRALKITGNHLKAAARPSAYTKAETLMNRALER